MPKLGGQSMNRDTSHDCTGAHSADQYPTKQQDATDSIVATEILNSGNTHRHSLSSHQSLLMQNVAMHAPATKRLAAKHNA